MRSFRRTGERGVVVEKRAMKWRVMAGGVAFYVSVVTHAALMLCLLRYELEHFWLYLPPVSRGVEVFVQAEEEALLPLRNRIGEEGGKGTGAHGAEGKALQYAMRGPQDQAWLSRDPVGAGLRGEERSLNLELSREVVGAEGGAIGVAPREGLVAPVVGPPARLVKLMPVAVADVIARGEVEERAVGTRPVEDVVGAVVGAEASAARAPVESRESTETGNGKVAAGAAADAAPESDSESDAFARIGSVAFKDGKLDVRLGRKVKTVRPRFTIKGAVDRASIVNPVTVVMVTVAETGKVSDVRVIRSSGSNELDLPWVLAVYKWWFEPAKDEGGKAVGDVVQLRLGVVDREF